MSSLPPVTRANRSDSSCTCAVTVSSAGKRVMIDDRMMPSCARHEPTRSNDADHRYEPPHRYMSATVAQNKHGVRSTCMSPFAEHTYKSECNIDIDRMSTF